MTTPTPIEVGSSWQHVSGSTVTIDNVRTVNNNHRVVMFVEDLSGKMRSSVDSHFLRNYTEL